MIIGVSLSLIGQDFLAKQGTGMRTRRIILEEKFMCIGWEVREDSMFQQPVSLSLEGEALQDQEDDASRNANVSHGVREGGQQLVVHAASAAP